MEQALKHQQQQIARDKRTIDHVNIAMRKILEKPNLEPEQKLNKALELLERISNDRFMFKQLNVHKPTMERIVTPLRNSIIGTMTSNTKQMMDQARQNRQKNYGSALPPPLPRDTGFLPSFEYNDFSGQDTQSCSSSTSWRSAEQQPPPLPVIIGPPPLPIQQNASPEDQQERVFEQPEIEVEMDNEAHTGIPFEPLTPVPMADPVELMSPASNMEDEDNVDIGDWSRQLDHLTTANQEALQGLQIEEQKK